MSEDQYDLSVFQSRFSDFGSTEVMIEVFLRAQRAQNWQQEPAPRDQRSLAAPK